MNTNSYAVKMLSEIPVYPRTISLKKLTKIIGKNASDVIKLFDSTILLSEDEKGNLCYPTIENKDYSIRLYNTYIRS